MEIKYLKVLAKYPELDGWKNEPISEDEIFLLEETFNNKNPFPVVLRELLTLAGNFCYALDYSIYDSQMEMQKEEHAEIYAVDNFIFPRPVYLICLASYGLPVFIFLDEGNNPPLNQMVNNPNQENYYRRTEGTIQTLIESRIRNHLRGYSMF